MRVCVLTTSYPSPGNVVAGSFVAAAVAGVRRQGVEVDVVSPDTFPHFGVALGGGIAQNLRRSPWKLALTPAFLTAYALAARRAARSADLVHAHWLPSAIAARATGKPYVVQVWGTDVELARRAPKLVAPLLRSASLVVAASSFLADAATRLGAREVAIVPVGVHLPERVASPVEPAHVLYAGRLSEEKGVLELVEAVRDLPHVVVGDGPLRARIPGAAGFVAPSELGAYYERASVVCVPSRREGYGMAAREALAYGRPVVASDVGGLRDLRDGTVLVPPRDPAALRAAIHELLDDPARRAELGAAARSYAARVLDEDAAAAALVAAYHRSL
jgi:glycosyltransferase involved in cell wall biosynthesis